jgi:glucose/arabinose dehydrogenase
MLKTFFKKSLLAASLGAISISAMATDIKVEEIALGLKNPWSIAFMANGDALLTERAGGLRKLTKAGELGPEISGLPEAAVVGQGDITP